MWKLDKIWFIIKHKFTAGLQKIQILPSLQQLNAFEIGLEASTLVSHHLTVLDRFVSMLGSEAWWVDKFLFLVSIIDFLTTNKFWEFYISSYSIWISPIKHYIL